MGEDPSVIRAQIDETRERVGDEVDALSYKTDVGARMGDYVDEKKEAVRAKVGGAKDAVTSVVPDPRRIKDAAGYLRETAESNPLGLAVGGIAVGFVLGTLLPQTKFENEQMGEASDRVLDAARDGGREAVERGKAVAQEAASAAVDTAKESGQEHSEELTSQLRERVQDQGGPESG
jgi:hypothetical protein